MISDGFYTQVLIPTYGPWILTPHPFRLLVWGLKGSNDLAEAASMGLWYPLYSVTYLTAMCLGSYVG